jgi:hypothetical protein
MDKSTAKAIHELATTGRLSDDSTDVVADVLGLDSPGAEDTPNKAATSAAKGSGR